MLRRAAAVACLAFGGCSSQGPPKDLYDLRVAISTDVAIPTEIDAVRVVVTREGVDKYNETYGYDAISQLPDALLLDDGTFNYSTSEPEYDPIVIRVDGLLGGEAVVTRSAKVVMPTDHEALLRMPLCTTCVGKPCDEATDPESTCKLGQCVDWSVGGSALEHDDAGLELSDPECPRPPPTCAGRCGAPGCGVCPPEPDGMTDVKRDAYAAWLAVNPQPVGDALGPGCSGVATFAPDPACVKSVMCEGPCGATPQTCVDACDAFAYCHWAGATPCEPGPASPDPMQPFRCCPM